LSVLDLTARHRPCPWIGRVLAFRGGEMSRPGRDGPGRPVMTPVNGTMKQAGVGRRFSAIELGAVLVLVAVVLVGIHGLAAGPVASEARGVARASAVDLVDQQIDRIRADSMLGPARYAGTETSIEGWPGYTRVTRVAAAPSSTASGAVEWLLVTVTARGPGRSAPVSRTVITQRR
jgi:hypothetical protein